MPDRTQGRVKMFHAHPGGNKGCIQPPGPGYACPYPDDKEGAEKARANSVLDQIAVNVAVRCLDCGSVLGGSPYWPARKSMDLHAMGTCTASRFEMAERA